MFTIERQRIKHISDSSLSDELLAVTDDRKRTYYVRELNVVYPEDKVKLHVIRHNRVIAYSAKMDARGISIAEDLSQRLRHQLGWDETLPKVLCDMVEMDLGSV